MSEYEYDFSKGVEQYKRIINGGEADWIPVTTQMAEFCMKYGGHNGHEFFSNPELFVRGSLDVQQEMGFHVPDMVWDVYSVEAEALESDRKRAREGDLSDDERKRKPKGGPRRRR